MKSKQNNASVDTQSGKRLAYIWKLETNWIFSFRKGIFFLYLVLELSIEPKASFTWCINFYSFNWIVWFNSRNQIKFFDTPNASLFFYPNCPLFGDCGILENGCWFLKIWPKWKIGLGKYHQSLKYNFIVHFDPSKVAKGLPLLASVTSDAIFGTLFPWFQRQLLNRLVYAQCD